MYFHLLVSVNDAMTCRRSFNPDSVLRYDHETQHAFVGDYSGQITLLKLEKQTYSTITTLKGHEGKEPPACTRPSLCPSAADLTHAVGTKTFPWMLLHTSFLCWSQICRCGNGDVTLLRKKKKGQSFPLLKTHFLTTFILPKNLKPYF